ncbi:MAG: TolB family protein [Acidimicrobiales bacterium]
MSDIVSSMIRQLFARKSCVVFLGVAVALGGCAGHSRENNSTTGSSPSSADNPIASVLSVPPGGWPGSPVVSVHALVANYGGRASWSPTGPIAYSVRDRVVNGTRYADIYVMNGNGTDRHCITCNNPAVPHLSNDVPVWDPNGRLIVFEGQNPSLGPISPHLSQGGAGFNNDLWAITPNGAHAWRLTDTLRGEAVLHPQFSPNGKELVWAAYDHPQGLRRLLHRGEWDIHVATFSVDTAGQPSLTSQHVYRPGQASSTTFYETHVVTDNGAIIFSSNMGSPYQPSCHTCALGIWEWTPGSPVPPVLLTPNTSAWNEHAALSPSGRHIAWITSQGERFVPSGQWGRTLRTDWWLMNPNGSHKIRATYFNTPKNPGIRVICAEGSWDPSGTALLATVDVIQGTSSTTEILELVFRSPQ